MEQLELFPQGPIDFVSSWRGIDCCPHCGEDNVTDQIHGYLTFLCGSYKCLSDTMPCEGKKYYPFVIDKALKVLKGKND